MACGPELGPARPARFMEVVSAMAERGSARGRAWKVAGPARTGDGVAGAWWCAASFSPVSAKASGRSRHHRHHDPGARDGRTIDVEATRTGGRASGAVTGAPSSSSLVNLGLVA